MLLVTFIADYRVKVLCRLASHCHTVCVSAEPLISLHAILVSAAMIICCIQCSLVTALVMAVFAADTTAVVGLIPGRAAIKLPRSTQPSIFRGR